jgi:hypothetical protein
VQFLNVKPLYCIAFGIKYWCLTPMARCQKVIEKMSDQICNNFWSNLIVVGHFFHTIFEHCFRLWLAAYTRKWTITNWTAFLTVPTTEQILDRFLYDLKVSLRVESPVSSTEDIGIFFSHSCMDIFDLLQ